MPDVEPIAPYLEPLRKSVTVALPAERAFELFTAGLATWWPLATHSCSGERAASCVIEPGVGGAVYETRDDGTRFEWGHVTLWRPPERFAMSWHPGRDASTAQEVEVRFVPTAAGVRVELEHRNWQALGEAAAETRAGYDRGWDAVLGGRFVAACATEAVR